MGKGERGHYLGKSVCTKLEKTQKSIVKETLQLSQAIFDPHVWIGLCCYRPELSRELFYHTWSFTNMIFPNVIS